MAGEEAVLGHFSQSPKQPLQPLLVESTALFRSLVADDTDFLQQTIEADPSCVSRLYLVLHWSSDGQGAENAAPQSRTVVKSRTLLHCAAVLGARRCLELLLQHGADPQQRSPDGMVAAQFAQSSGGNIQAVQEMLQVLQQSSADGNVSGSNAAGAGADLAGGAALMVNGTGGLVRGPAAAFSDADMSPSVISAATVQFPLGMDLQGLTHHQDVESDLFNTINPEGLPYSTSELTQDEYSTDEWRMFGFKVMRCAKRFAHDWRACPFAHPTENARRRDPREFRYCAIACPEYKQGFCLRGDVCPYAHGVFECWLHPSRYRTQLCKDGANCHRPICFFAHSLPELRTPTHTWTPTPEDLLNSRASSGNLNNTASPSSSGQHQVDHLTSRQHQVEHRQQDSPPVSVAGKGTGGSSVAGSDPGMNAAVTAGAVAPPAPGANAAAMFGFTAPRMSNAFARRHGLNPKDNAMLNLQKIALQAQVPDPVAAAQQQQLQQLQQQQQHNNHNNLHAGRGGNGGMNGGGYGANGGGYAGNSGGYGNGMGYGMGGGVGGYGGNSGRGMGQAMAMAAAAAANRKQFQTPGQVMMPPFSYQTGGGLGAMQAAAAAAHDPSALAALNNQLAALTMHPHAAAAAAAFAGAHGTHMGGMPYGGGYGQHAMTTGDGSR